MVDVADVDKARDFIDAYNRRDFDAAIESFDPGIIPLGNGGNGASAGSP